MAISEANSFSMMANIPSGPVSFLGLSAFCFIVTSGIVQSKFKGSLSLGNGSNSTPSNGGADGRAFCIACRLLELCPCKL